MVNRQRPRWAGPALLNPAAIALAALLAAAPAHAQVPPEPEPVTPLGGDVDADAEGDPCAWQPERPRPAERLRAGLFRFSCRTVRGFDRLFGDDEPFDVHQFGGMLTLGLIYNEYEGFDPKLRFRLRTDLPNLSSRFNAFIGRVEEEVAIEDRRLSETSPFRDASDGDERSWLLGLGYRRPTERSRYWDWDAGIRLRTPLQPYARGRYHIDWRVDEDTEYRFRQTFFWRDGIGFGTTSHLDMGQQVTDLDHLRWESVATFSEDTEGVDWWTGTTWFRRLDGPSGIALLAFSRGETDAPVNVKEYGFALTWRRPFMGRDWMWINFGPTATWPREELDEERELSLGFAVTTEIEFGDWRY